MTFVRPNGYFTSRFVDDQKRNPIEMLKHFLFNSTSGRTDVLFVGERNTYFQDPRESKRPALVGGLADGIAKALLTSTAFSPRTLYATPIYWGYHGNAPGDTYNEATFNWSNDTASGNPEGHGRCLVGTKYGFDSYAYTRNASNNVVLPLNAEKNSVSLPAVLPWSSALFLTEMYSSSTELNTAWFTPIFFDNSYNYGENSIGPISYPQFLGTKTKHILFPNIPMAMPIGKYDQSTNIITEYFIDSTTLAILRNSLIDVNERFPNNITVGNNISTLDNTKFTFDGGIINFKCKINEFLIPILKHKGWTVCESGACTGEEDAYFGNYLDQNPSSLWVLNRHLPYNYSGLGNQYLFANQTTSQYFTNYKFGFVSDKHLNSSISGLYNGETDRGLPACVHYTRVPEMGLCMGSDFLKTNFEYPTQSPTNGFKLTFDKFNVANQKISSYFVWKKDWENESNLTYKKEKKIILNTNLGSVLNTFSVTPNLTVTLRIPTDKATLYTTTNFEYKVKYWDLRVNSTTSVPNNQSKLAITIAKRVNNVWTNLVDTSHSFTSPTSFTSPSATRKYVTTTIDLTSPNNVAPEYSLSFTGFNSTNRLEGDNIIINHWGENVNDTNGISFSHLYMSEDFRSGDVAYAFQAPLVKQQFYEIFDSIKERQKNNPEGRKKVVIAIPSLRFENANPGDGYVSGWSQMYMSGIKETILNTAYKCGFSDNEIVVWFIGPMFGPKVNYWSNEITNYSTDAPRATYLKSQFIMIGSASTNPLGGLLKAHEPWTPNSPSDQHYIPNALYTDLEQVSSLGGIRDTLSNNTTSRAVYSSTSASGEESFFHTPSIEGFLVVGHELVKSVESITSASYFAPPWVIAYSYMLNYQFDPVSEADLAFVTPSLDPVDIKPYLVAFDNICDDPTSSYNFQAKSILNKFKTKILQ